jgi:hypothetical protein
LLPIWGDRQSAAAGIMRFRSEEAA